MSLNDPRPAWTLPKPDPVFTFEPWHEKATVIRGPGGFIVTLPWLTRERARALCERLVEKCKSEGLQAALEHCLTERETPRE